MRRTLIAFHFLVLLMIFMPRTLLAQETGFGAGVMLGEPTGFTFKNWLTARTAFDVGVAWSFTNDGSFHLHADYLWHSFHAFKTKEKVPLYYGVGGRILAGHDARLGVRGVVGVSYLVPDAPFDAFIEIAPIVDIAPETTLRMNADIGLRYYFE